MIIKKHEAKQIANDWGYDKLTDLQEMTFDNCSCGVSAREFIIGSTSSGKTLVPLICYKYDKQLAQRNVKMLYIVPYKALATQKEREFKNKFSKEKVIVCTSEYCSEDNDVQNADCDIAIVIYEKVYMFLSNNKNLLSNYSHIVFDEIGIVNNMERGLKADYVFSKACSEEFANVYALATPYYNWDYYVDTYGFVAHIELSRPIEIENAIEMYEMQETRPNILKLNKQIFDICKKHRSMGHKILLFANSRNRVKDLARSLFEQFVDVDDKELSDAKGRFFSDLIMTEDDLFGIFEDIDYLAFKYGISYHNASLPEEIREKIEKAFLSDKGGLDIVVSTETLAYGLNSNVDVVIVTEMDKPAGKNIRRFLTVNEYQNFIGRAGRLGKKSKGYSYTFLNDLQMEEWKKLMEKTNNPDSIESLYKNVFDIEECVFHLLNYYDNKMGVCQKEVLTTINKYPGDWSFSAVEILDVHENNLLKRKFIRYEEDELDDIGVYTITEIGKRALGFIITLETYDVLFKTAAKMYKRKKIQLVDFLYDVCRCPEMMLTDRWGQKEQVNYRSQAIQWLKKMKECGQVSDECFDNITKNPSIKKFKNLKTKPTKEDYDELRKLRMVEALYKWMECYSIEEISKICHFEYGTIKRMGEKAKYITDILACEVSMVQDMNYMEHLLKRIGLSLHYGVRMDTIEKLDVFELDPIDGRQLRTIGRILNIKENYSKNKEAKLSIMINHISVFPEKYKDLIL